MITLLINFLLWILPVGSQAATGIQSYRARGQPPDMKLPSNQYRPWARAPREIGSRKGLARPKR